VVGIDSPQTIDAISLDRPEKTVTMTIFDAWDWLDEDRHLLAMQTKVNSYFDFIQSGQIFESYPKAVGKQLLIDVVTQYPIPAKAVELLRRADALATKLNARVAHRVQRSQKSL
jgi:hypothetical protein